MVTPNAAGLGTTVSNTLNISDVTRASWSVGLICDAGLDVKFTKDCSNIYNAKGREVCHFERKHGLYTAQVQLENPEHPDFIRLGA